MKRRVVVALTLIAVTAGTSAGQTAPRWLSCQRKNLCTVTDKGWHGGGGIERRIQEKAASACSAAGFSFYLPVSEVEVSLTSGLTARGSLTVRFHHEDDPGGSLFECNLNLNHRFRQEALLAGRSWGWPVAGPTAEVPSDVADEQGGRAARSVSGNENREETYAPWLEEPFTPWLIEETTLAATGDPVAYTAGSAGPAAELRIGCLVPTKQSFVQVSFAEDLGRARTAQVWYGVTELQAEEWNLADSRASLDVSGGIANLSIAAEIESAGDVGNLLLSVPSADGSTRHQAVIDLVGSLPALGRVHQKCAAAFSAQP